MSSFFKFDDSTIMYDRGRVFRQTLFLILFYNISVIGFLYLSAEFHHFLAPRNDYDSLDGANTTLGLVLYLIFSLHRFFFGRGDLMQCASWAICINSVVLLALRLFAPGFRPPLDTFAGTCLAIAVPMVISFFALSGLFAAGIFAPKRYAS